ncbi:Na+/H+ antiporter subunit E [Aminivibrio sp.]|jgi:multicomponent Na+:H+ antiporter subunit E|uniref:Na+/H+ antiporter subunit E n=1 Tax=Aminivibrio sp. TaxID=1872489 RepID=UPI001DE5B292|nr:Na+/H+ antiporter subunit E [Synergistaceae bacterium]MDD3390759.1 Na+/H+ antiporter subunit E [Synergistaceae bacterium]MDD4022092.1 Na+/H+ antiporter subunit E [Synergistaceae bacterium]MDD4612130.1 Na+/H+ antiporter subunit E [Synergistaceae bacterium]NCC57551.1 hypothetical protein [Synergistales bacterium]
MKEIIQADQGGETLRIPPGVFLLFLVLFASWIAMGGSFSPLFLLVGAILCLFISIVTWRPFFGRRMFFSPAGLFRRGGFFLLFIPSFLLAMVKASLEVAFQAFSPALDISPGTFVYRPSLRSKGSIVALANAVTLTPGTLTVDMSPFGELTVHALVTRNGGIEKLKEDIGKLEKGIGRFAE